MKHAIKDFLNSLARLLRFVTWYAIAVAAAFYVLPAVGFFLEGQYDSMTRSVKFFAVIGFFMVVAIWQIAGRRDRIRSSHGRSDSRRIPLL